MTHDDVDGSAKEKIVTYLFWIMMAVLWTWFAYKLSRLPIDYSDYPDDDDDFFMGGTSEINNTENPSRYNWRTEQERQARRNFIEGAVISEKYKGHNGDRKDTRMNLSQVKSITDHSSVSDTTRTRDCSSIRRSYSFSEVLDRRRLNNVEQISRQNDGKVPIRQNSLTLAPQSPPATLLLSDDFSNVSHHSGSDNQNQNDDQAEEKGESRIVCSICLSEYEEDDIISRSPNILCTHFFHKNCITEWLMSCDECPCCRCDYLTRNDTDTDTSRDSQETHNTGTYAFGRIQNEDQNTTLEVPMALDMNIDVNMNGMFIELPITRGDNNKDKKRDSQRDLESGKISQQIHD